MSETKIIDWNYHCIRRAIYLQYVYFDIWLKYTKKQTNQCHLKNILDNICQLKIKEENPKDFYKYLDKISKINDLDYFPLCKLSSKPKYNEYCKKIKKIIEKIQNNYKNQPLSIIDLKPKEAIILHYMIQIFTRKRFANILPSTIYNIIDYFEECKQDMLIFLQESKNIQKIVTDMMKKLNTNIEWKIEPTIKLDIIEHKKFKIWTNIPIIGYDDKNTYHLFFTTDLNQLNYWKTLIKILIERFIIYNSYEAYNGKNIITYLLILKQNKYEIFDWNWDKNLTMDIRIELKNALIKYFSNFNNELYMYYQYVKDNKEIWKSFQNPLLFMSDKFKDIPYIVEYFNELNIKSRNEKENVRHITNNKELFCNQLIDRIENMLEIYLKIHEQNNDNDEW